MKPNDEMKRTLPYSMDVNVEHTRQQRLVDEYWSQAVRHSVEQEEARRFHEDHVRIVTGLIWRVKCRRSWLEALWAWVRS